MWASDVPWPVARVWYWFKRQTLGRYDQWQRDRARVRAFCLKHDLHKVNGKWRKP